MRFLTLLPVLFALDVAKPAKILGVFYMPAPSHYILGSSLMKALAEKGHDVTIVAAFAEKNVPKNGTYRQIELKEIAEDMNNVRKEKKMNMYDMEDSNMFIMLPFILDMVYKVNELTLKSTEVQKLLQSDEKFDLVILEQFVNEAQKGFASHFGAPLVLLSTVGANYWVNNLVGNPAPPSFVPDVFLSYSSRMTFWERTVNALMRVYAELLYSCISFPREKQLYDKHFPGAPDFYDTIYNASLVLLNSHPSTNQPVPYVPNMIDIGGYHVQPPKKLPEDLQSFLDGAKDGVIYFSMGSNLKSSDLPPEKRDAFLKVFGKLKQKVLWKWEEDVLPGQPENVKLGKWLPQQDILAHPNVKLFITHGGLLSTTETIYHGVPVLAIPIAGDQKLNAQRISNEGFGLVLYYKEISEKSLTEKLQELLNNPTYHRNAKRRSEIFHDRPSKPIDTAIYWIEYVIRHKGAPHLKVAGVDLPWYQYLLLDVIAVLLTVFLLGLYVFYKVAKFSIALFSGKKEKNLKKIKKQ